MIVIVIGFVLLLANAQTNFAIHFLVLQAYPAFILSLYHSWTIRAINKITSPITQLFHGVLNKLRRQQWSLL